MFETVVEVEAEQFQLPKIPSGKLPHLRLDTFKNNGYLTHNIHPYPAKFVPQIPATLIDALSKPGDVVLDPFCGSGTTVLEALLKGRIAIGSDSNELSVRIARAKTTIVSDNELRLLQDLSARVATLLLPPAERSDRILDPVVPEFKNRDHWFAPGALLDLGLLNALISTVTEPKVRCVAEVVFSAIVVKSSRQDSDTRWVAVDRPYKSGSAFTFFHSRLSDCIGALIALRNRVPQGGSVFLACEDARSLPSVRSESVDLVVTSPPYVNSYDYYLYHKLRMFWLGIDHRTAQVRELGSRNKHCDQGEALEAFYGPMRECASSLNRALRPGGRIAIVVGDSIFQGSLVDMGEVYSSLFSEVGLGLIDTQTFDQRKYTRAFTPKMKTIPKKTHVLLFEKN